MSQSLIACPLCSAASFSNTSALCLSLVNIASKWLRCSMCEEELRGLDKFTIHLLGHLINTPNFNRLLTNETSYSDSRPLFSSQPFDFFKCQSKQANNELDQKLSTEGINLDPMHVNMRNETPSLKIDDEVMIIFNNCNRPQMKDSENSVVKDIEKDAPSSSGLPKFTINFDTAAGSCQSENVTHSEIKSISSDGNNFDEGSNNEHQYLFPINNISEGTVNQKYSDENLKESKLQMEFSDDKEGDVYNFAPSIENTSQKIIGTGSSSIDCNIPKNVMGNKSSFLSPKGERVLGFRCDICSLVFPDERILSMHRQLIHIELHRSGPSEPSSYKCHLCSKSFVMKGSLMVHMRVAHFGGAVVARLVEAKQLETDAVSPESAQFICPICNKGFQKEQQLAQHEKLHDGKQCDVCFKTFTTKYFLRKHKRLHTGEMPYQCNQCNKSFTFQQSYHKHLLYHSDDKPYSCGDCGRTFKELSTLHNHQRIHTGEKPFSCETCGKCFRQRVSYLVHRRIHTGVMPYQCQDCGKTFRYKVSERTHKCSSSTTGGSTEVAILPSIKVNQEQANQEKQKSNEDSTGTKQVAILESEAAPMSEMFSGPPDFFSLIMSPSNRLQHLSLTSEPMEDSRSQSEPESIDSEALKQLLYDVADYT